MTTAIPTTPFGRRPLTLGQVTTRLEVRRAMKEAAQPGSNHPAAVNKWQIFRTLTEIRERLGVSDRSLGVLNALLSFHQETALTLPRPRDGSSHAGGEGSSCDLVVFPSNKALGLRAHGMAPATLRRHLAALVEAGLVLRRDSPNGKRYARKDASGTDRFSDAFGFDLTPLVARAPEFEALADEVRRERGAFRILKERVSLLRRDITKLIACGVDESLPGEWGTLLERFAILLTPLRQVRTAAEMEAIAAKLTGLKADATKLLEEFADSHYSSTNGSQSERHESNSNPPISTDLEPAFKEGGVGEVEPRSSTAAQRRGEGPYPLGLVLDACPDLIDYHAGGDKPRVWHDFIAAARLVRPMLGISPDAWRDAVLTMGERDAAVAVAVILQRCEHSSEATTVRLDGSGQSVTVIHGSPAIKAPGGYLRALTEKARVGEFSLGPILMALIGQRLKARRMVKRE